MNNTIRDTALPRSATERDCVGVMPIVRAEKTAIASFIPKPAGVIATMIPREPIDIQNKHSASPTSIPNTLNCK